jgi:hypothetical protein
MVEGGQSAFGIGVDLGIQMIAIVLLVALAARLYPSVVR